MATSELTRGEGEDILVYMRRRNRWQEESGVVCRKCDAFIIPNMARPPGYPALCHDCRALAENDGEVTSHTYVRCPACGATTSPLDDGDYGLTLDGACDTTCPECGHAFEVTTSITYTFTSPARIGVAEPEDEDEPNKEEDDGDERP
jgi:hypothetical protein